MSRCRNIKPGLWLNEDLAECSIPARYLFPALWCHADKEGRLEYRPKKLKAEVFPYDNVNIQQLIVELHGKKFVEIYEHEGQLYINIPNFKKHQNPHPKEKASDCPVPVNMCIYDRKEKQFIYKESNLIIPFPSDVLIPSPSDIPLPVPSDIVEKEFFDFEIFWDAFDYKKGRGGAEKSWNVIKGMNKELFEKILSGARNEALHRPALLARGGTPKMAQGWLTERRWEDEHKEHALVGKVASGNMATMQRIIELQKQQGGAM